MEAPAELLMSSLGAIAVLLMLYIYIFAFERRLFLVLWFIGWVIIGLNYCADALAPQLLRGSRLNLLISLGSYFLANLSIICGTLLFLKKRVRKLPLLGLIWPFSLLLFSSLRWEDVQLIQYANLTVMTLYAWMGVLMMRMTKQYGKLIFGLGLLNLLWVLNTIVFVYVVQAPQLAPYFVSQMILVLNAAGLVQFFFRQQKNDIERGLAHITYLTCHDELTNLYNKAYFDNKIQELRFSREVPISVLVGDMNGLKLVNDIFGHKEGDSWLKRMADIIRRFCREDHIAARWGGDEFALILPNTNYIEALELCGRICGACTCEHGSGISLSISMGIATKAEADEDLVSVLKKAEDLMYEKKLIEGKRAKWTIIEALNRLQEKKDCGAVEHVARLERVAADFAEILKLGEEDADRLILAMRLHNLSVINTGEGALMKFPMNKMDWTTVKKHVGISYRMAHASEEFAPLADLMLYHHEWWNGQGYPQGLNGGDIPLLSRIIAILEVFDAMGGGESAKALQDALDELRAKAGLQLDPHLTAEFIAMMHKWQGNPKLSINDNYSDKDKRASVASV